MKDCNLIKRLVDAWSDYFEIKEKNTVNNEEKSKPKKLNTNGYMGHLTVISNHIYKNTIEGKYAPYIKECLNKCIF